MFQLFHNPRAFTCGLIVVSVPSNGCGVNIIAVPIITTYAFSVKCTFQCCPLVCRHYPGTGILTESILINIQQMAFNHIVGLPVLFKRRYITTCTFYLVSGLQSVLPCSSQYHIFRRITSCKTLQETARNDVLGVGIRILIEVYRTGLQISRIIDAIIGYCVSGVNLHVIRVVFGTFKEPNPTRTRARATFHLLVAHHLSIDVQVAVTITIRIDGLNLTVVRFLCIVRNQLIATILEIVSFCIRIEEL